MAFDSYPQHAGGTGGRYLLIPNGGEDLTGTGRPKRTLIATAARPAVP
ncbi:MAG: hypothetical protein KDB90_02860 [Planctomycetes bacterium]|nr:hypothetical protein [Planctomycetota bacterium]